MLSASSSFISTNCPDRILSTGFLGMTSEAGDNSSPACGTSTGLLTGDVLMMAAVMSELQPTGVGAGTDNTGWVPTVDVTATDANDTGGGRVPRPGAATGLMM